MKTNLNHFTSKMYLVTYEFWYRMGCCEYGIMSVHNKPQSAYAALKKLIKQQDKEDQTWPKGKYKFDLKTVDINSPFHTKLFDHIY
jgi:hypothetical protein